MDTAIELELDCAALPEDRRLVLARGEEGMNRLSRWQVTFLTADVGLPLDSAIGAQAVLRLLDHREGSTRSIGLVVTDIAYEGAERGGHRYVVDLAPFEHRLTLRAGYRVCLDKGTLPIVSDVLKDAGVPAGNIVPRLSGAYKSRVQCVQYNESDWGFVERLLADEGISYWFDYDDGKGGTLVLGDDPAAHDGVAPPTIFPFEDATGLVHLASFHALEIEDVLVPTAVHVRDYDIRQPGVYIEGRSGTGPLEHFEYPACVADEEAAKVRASVRLDQLRRLETVARGATGSVRVQPGRVLDVAGCSDDSLNGRYLVIGVTHRFSRGYQQAEQATRYENHVSMVPAETRAFRPEVPVRVPRVDTIEPVVTTGASGEEIHVDDLGRVKVRFLWDRSGIADDKSSAWTRSIQMQMGGSMLLPRVGWEVPVAYVDGVPDRPFVLGRFYNGTAVVPYAQPGGSAISTLQSESSPGGGSTNEIRTTDTAGGMEFFMHASKDQTVAVGGSSTTKVGVNETHDVGLGYTLIAASQTETVGASQSWNVQTDIAHDAKGSRSESIGGMEVFDVTGNRTVHVKGPYNELIGAMYGIQCNQSNTVVQGVYTQMIGAALGLAAGLGARESVAAARTELVGGAKTLTVAKDVNESIRGAKTIVAGKATDKADGKNTMDVKGAASVSAGGSITVNASGDVCFDAPSISIKVGGKVKAGPLEIGGGKLKAKSGTTSFKGDIKRSGGSNKTG
ncbi:MAG: type VI secretion system tip protein TssI/VgrG [Polyangiaceae bacterium]